MLVSVVAPQALSPMPVLFPGKKGAPAVCLSMGRSFAQDPVSIAVHGPSSSLHDSGECVCDKHPCARAGTC
jgi:hypothetical protein